MLPAHLEVGEEVVGVAGAAGEGRDLQVLLPHPGFPIDDIVYSDEKKDLYNTCVSGSATTVSQISQELVFQKVFVIFLLLLLLFKIIQVKCWCGIFLLKFVTFVFFLKRCFRSTARRYSSGWKIIRIT